MSGISALADTDVDADTDTDAVRVMPPVAASTIAIKRVAVTTLGCKVNAFESEMISEALKKQHWQTVSPREQADLYLINTCTVTAEADRQARQSIRRAVRQNPDALVVVTGCYAQMSPEICAEIPGVDLVLGNGRKLDMHKLLPKLEQGELPKIVTDDVDAFVSLPDELLGGYEGHTRAFVQIQQGCDQGCTFCIIHKARGRSRSLPVTLIKRQVQRLLLNGYREIVLCGVDLGSYGKDFSSSQSYGFEDLIDELVQIQGADEDGFRIRLSSIDPAHIGDRLIEQIATHSRLCKHIHLSMQSGSTLILKRMKRRYTADVMLERIARLRERVPELVISADVMAGFPTESEECFNETVLALETMEVAFPHTFAYSVREGTPAARIPRQVNHDERKSRAKVLRQRGAEIRQRVLARQVGKLAKVLVEATTKDGRLRARADNYLPVLLNTNNIDHEKLIGTFLDVTIQRADAENLYAQVNLGV